METVSLDNDVTVIYITAKYFPEGISEAHEKIHSLVPYAEGRRFFGISRPEEENGPIIYKAAAEELKAGEADKLNLKTVVLKKGKYNCIRIKNYTENLPAIAKAFEQILQQPDLDPNGYCVEWYVNENELKCMVRSIK